VQWLAWDLTDTAGLAAAAPGAQVVVHALNPVYTNKAWRAQAPALMECAIALAQELRATLMLPGNVYNFGSHMPALLGEDTQQTATTLKGQIRIALEQQMQQAALAGSMKAVVIRAGDYFGSGTGSWFDQVMVKDVRSGKFSYPGSLHVPTAWAYLPDLARSFVAVAERRESLAPFTPLHFAGYSLTGQQWLDALTPIACAHGWLKAGAPLKLASMPWPLLRAGAWMVPTWASLVEMAYLWRTPHALGNTKLQALIGAEPHTPLPAALQSALQGLGFSSEGAPYRAEPVHFAP